MSTLVLILSTMIYLVFYMSGTHSIQHSDCGSSNSTTIWNVRLKNCEDLEVCELVRGNTTTLDVDFTTDLSPNSTKMVINGKIGGIYLPFAFKQKDACQAQDSGLECPLKPENYTYHAEVDVKEQYPPIGVDLRFKLMDLDSKDKVFCILIPAKLV